ncbi:MAG: GNAT family N-acetyltransferase, partial [Chloroflexota bacterium]
MNIIKDLGNGLVLRRSGREDAEKLFAFNAMIHGEEVLDERIGQWSHDLVSKPHPTFNENDYTIIEETATGRIVSSLNLISQSWTYEGIPFGVGRPELVGTLPEFRNKGLVRLQMEEIHRWSADRGQLVQAITGIPNYYRMFGYEMCVDLEGSRSGFEMNLPKLPAENLEEPYRLRAATISDISFVMEVSAYAAGRSLIYTERNEEMWRYELNGRSDNSINRLLWQIIEKAADGSAVG